MENSRNYYVAKTEEVLNQATSHLKVGYKGSAELAQAAAFVAAQYIELAKMAREE